MCNKNLIKYIFLHSDVDFVRCNKLYNYTLAQFILYLFNRNLYVCDN